MRKADEQLSTKNHVVYIPHISKGVREDRQRGGELVIDMVLVYKAGGTDGCFTQSINMVQSSKAILLSALRKFDYLAKSLKWYLLGLTFTIDQVACVLFARATNSNKLKFV